MLSGAKVSVGAKAVGIGVLLWKMGIAGNLNRNGWANNANTIPAAVSKPRTEKACLARTVFCSRARKLMERLDSCKARMPMM